jgi:protein phosphatase
MKLTIPEFSLVLLVGIPGSGKSRFAQRHFAPTEILSSDHFRGLVSDNESNQAATKDALEVLHRIAAKRLVRRRLTVVDATNVYKRARTRLVSLARAHHCIPVAVVFNLPVDTCLERNRVREDRRVGRKVIAQQAAELQRSLAGLMGEGFRYVHELTTTEAIDAATIERTPLRSNRRDDHGPFDIIGDIHGCADELEALLERLGYVRGNGQWQFAHPQGRRVVFLGDVVDRGPRILDTYHIVRAMVDFGNALGLPGNHDVKLVRKLRGRPVRVAYGLEQTLEELEALPEKDRETLSAEISEFFESLASHYVLDRGRLVVAHAGMKSDLQGRASGRVRHFALYGETTGETDEFGLPVRYNWAADYGGRARVVYGHTPVPEPEWLNRTINIDTGCVFGGKLTALRYPQLELVSVAAVRAYCQPSRPLNPPAEPRNDP